LPNDAKIIADIERVAKDLMALRKAPVIEPYTGPAILSGRASGVFFHEIFGHRIEGHRQKSEFEGNTFTAKINQAVLPTFFSVVDDPTIKKYGTTDLSGYYQFDDEGVKAQRVPLVQNGILKTFLMSRSPIKGFDKSNGHGRAQPGSGAVSRQGNLIVQANKTVTKAELRRLLIAEIKRQRKSFGLLFDDISGGFTNTTRFAPQAFQVTPIMVYKVFPNGKPDELVRGVDLIGTPLTAFSKIVAADDTPDVFNGICGAESGLIPVSAISPGVLISQIEVQKRPKSKELPPILPPPGVELKVLRGNKQK
jgi:predicted Zn-dependent protease